MAVNIFDELHSATTEGIVADSKQIRHGSDSTVSAELENKIDFPSGGSDGQVLTLYKHSPAWKDAQSGSSSADKVSYDDSSTSLEATTVQGAIEKVVEELDDKLESEDSSSSEEGDVWSIVANKLALKEEREVTIEPTLATEDDYYDDPSGVDSIVEGDYLYTIDCDATPGIIFWSNTANTLHVYCSESCHSKISIMRMNGGLVCIENARYTRSSNVTSVGDNAIYEIQDDIMSVTNLTEVQ